MNILVFPIATYGSECCVVKQSDRKRLASFALRSYRRLLHICIDRRKLAFLGHGVRRGGLGKDLVTGMVFGKRKRGRPKTKYKDNIKELTNLSMVQVYRMVQDRREWKHFLMDATANHSDDLYI